MFTGIGYKDFILDCEYVTEKGIAIASTPDAPTHAVAEWAITMALAMNRNIFETGRVGDEKFMTSKGVEGQHIGIVGLGRIGKAVAEMIRPFRPGSVSYYSKSKHDESSLEYKDFSQLVSESDILFLCVSKDAGPNFFGEEQMKLMKDGALLVTFMAEGIVDEKALLKELQSGRIRAASDHPMENEESNNLSLGTWYCSNASTAFNTEREIEACSDMAVGSMINLLTSGNDQNKVN